MVRHFFLVKYFLIKYFRVCTYIQFNKLYCLFHTEIQAEICLFVQELTTQTTHTHTMRFIK